MGFKKEREKDERMEKVRTETIERLTNDQAIQEYFSEYNSYYLESFISGYASSKSIFMEYGEFYEDLGEKQETSFMENAEDCLKAIQLKKLFDLRCQWGAELITIPEITVSSDFWIWADDILNCKFIEPVNKADIVFYRKKMYFIILIIAI